MKRTRMIMLVVSLFAFAACGSGGGGAGNAPVVLTKATLKLATAGTGTVHGIDITVNLAEGVTVKSTNPPNVDNNSITLSEIATGSTVTAVYSAATSTLPGKVRILVVNANGFTTGEFCSVNGDIASDHSPKAADFSLENFSAWDAGGNVISGLTPQVTADIL